MTLATTCPECRTSFKVVPDQLKLHRGLVRCGKCQQVFSGIDFLTYLEADDGAPPSRAPGSAAAPDSRSTGPTFGTLSVPMPQGDAPQDDGLNTVVAAAVFRSARTTVDRTSTSEESTPPQTRPSDEPVATTAIQMPEEVAASAAMDIETGRITRASDPDLAQPSSSVDPVPPEPVSLESVPIKQAPVGPPRVESEPETDAALATEPQIPRARLPWVATAAIGVLVLALLAQAALGWRNEITARIPALAPWFKQAGFATQAPRDRSAVSIESFELRALDVPGRLELLAVLRNRASHPVAEPAMELRLTDSSGAVVVRKVLRPGDLPETPGSAAGTLPARSEKPIRLMLELTGPAPSGYSVDLFYP